MHTETVFVDDGQGTGNGTYQQQIVYDSPVEMFLAQNPGDPGGHYWTDTSDVNNVLTYWIPYQLPLQQAIFAFDQNQTADINAIASIAQSLNTPYGFSIQQLAAAVPVFGNEHRAALNSGYTNGSNYYVIGMRIIADAMRQNGYSEDAVNAFVASQNPGVVQGAQQAQQRWQQTQQQGKSGLTAMLVGLAIGAGFAYFGFPSFFDTLSQSVMDSVNASAATYAGDLPLATEIGTDAVATLPDIPLATDATEAISTTALQSQTELALQATQDFWASNPTNWEISQRALEDQAKGVFEKGIYEDPGIKAGVDAADSASQYSLQETAEEAATTNAQIAQAATITTPGLSLPSISPSTAGTAASLLLKALSAAKSLTAVPAGYVRATNGAILPASAVDAYGNPLANYGLSGVNPSLLLIGAGVLALVALPKSSKGKRK